MNTDTLQSSHGQSPFSPRHGRINTTMCRIGRFYITNGNQRSRSVFSFLSVNTTLGWLEYKGYKQGLNPLEGLGKEKKTHLLPPLFNITDTIIPFLPQEHFQEPFNNSGTSFWLQEPAFGWYKWLQPNHQGKKLAKYVSGNVAYQHFKHTLKSTFHENVT